MDRSGRWCVGRILHSGHQCSRHLHVYGSWYLALPERQRTALTLFHFEGMSQNEVAAAMDISAEAVESLLARARRGLKAALKDEWTALTDS